MRGGPVNKAGLGAYLREFEHPGGVIVCTSPKFVYMKPAKTGGTSLLRGVLGEVADVFHDKDDHDRFSQWLATIDDDELASYYFFTVVRNPWERLQSTSRYFDTPIDQLLAGFRQRSLDETTHTHLLPQHPYSHRDGERFVDAVCRLETLQEDINLVFDDLGLARTPLPHVNRTRRPSRYHPLTPQEAARFAEIYTDDLTIFGYEEPQPTTSGREPLRRRVNDAFEVLTGRRLRRPRFARPGP